MKLIIIGASGHGRVVADIAKKSGYDEIVFLDNDPNISTCAGYPVLGVDSMVSQLEGDLFIAVGNGQVRKKLMEREARRNFSVLVHPNAHVLMITPLPICTPGLITAPAITTEPHPISTSSATTAFG